MMLTYKYLLRPNNQQADRLVFLLEQHRIVYNHALQQRINIYKETGECIGYDTQCQHFRDIRRENPDTLGLVNASSLQRTLRRLDKTYTSFFRRLQSGEKVGFPRFKSRSRFNTMEYTYGDGCKLRTSKRKYVFLYVQNIGEIRLCYHRAIPEDSRINHARITRRNGRWYVSLSITLSTTPVQRTPTGKPVGVDVGLRRIAALSTGELIENPRWLRNNLARLRRLQRHASRQVKGSRRQHTTYRRIARLYEKIENQRRDYLHKISQSIVNKYTVIAVEDLKPTFMNRSRHLARASYDTGFGIFRRMLEYKAESAGIPLIAVSPVNTSQACSGCGRIVPKDVSVRVHQCLHCGLTLDRDVNAARNILMLALQNPPGRGGQPITWADMPSVG
ncbi:MAG: transposase [Chloroflexus sp.]|nr:transposase [Chloroflexus sp.]